MDSEKRLKAPAAGQPDKRARGQPSLDRHRAPEGFLLYAVDLVDVRDQLANGTYPALGDTPTYTGLLAATLVTSGTQSTRFEEVWTT